MCTGFLQSFLVSVGSLLVIRMSEKVIILIVLVSTINCILCGKPLMLAETLQLIHKAHVDSFHFISITQTLLSKLFRPVQIHFLKVLHYYVANIGAKAYPQTFLLSMTELAIHQYANMC